VQLLAEMVRELLGRHEVTAQSIFG
jgi:hypothetical protein